MQIKKIASFDVRDGASTVRYADLDDGISFFPTDGIINIKSNKVRIAGFGVDANSLYRIKSSGEMYPLGDQNSVFLSNEGKETSASIGGSTGNNKWLLAISDDFGVTDGGTLYAKNANIDGTIQSSKGRIGGWDIGADHLQNGDENDLVYVGNGANGGGDFLVVRSGGKYPFWVHKDGTMYCNKAIISGNITAREGQIASYTISGDYLMSSDEQVGMSAGNTSFWAGYDKSDGSYKFKVTKDGAFTATNANISGTINGATITGNVTNGGTITGGNIWGDFVQAQFLQTASNSATNGHGCDIWTGAIKCTSIIDQIGTSKINLTKQGVTLHGPGRNYLSVRADDKVWVNQYDGGVMNSGTIVFSRFGGHTISFYWGNDTGGWHLQTYVDDTYVGNAV